MLFFEGLEASLHGGIVDLPESLPRLLFQERAVDDVVSGVSSELFIAVTTNNLSEALIVLFDGVKFTVENFVFNFCTVNEEGHRRKVAQKGDSRKWRKYLDSRRIAGTMAPTMMKISKAFVLGAGLGKRLRPLTDHLPKPLVPVWNRPLISYAFDHLIADLGVSEFAVNTHHCPDRYGESFPDGQYEGHPLHFRHEPTLLDTAGGIDNLRDWLPVGEPFLVYNGDILTDLPLRPAWEQHIRGDDVVTLLLRSKGDELRVGFDPETSKVVDMRGVLAPDWPLRFQFTGIYLVSPAFLRYLTPGKIESVVFPLLKAIQDGRKVGGIVVDEGAWSDLGERNAYLNALHIDGSFPRYGAGSPDRISPRATIAATAMIDAVSAVGADAVIGEGSVLEESVIWSGAVVAPGAHLRRVVVRTGQSASGDLDSVDL